MKIAILGAAARGRDIAQACAVAGHTVHLHAAEATAVMDTVDVIERRLDDQVDAGTLEAGTRDDAVDRLEATTGLEAAVADAGIVVETTLADVDLLQKRFAELEDEVGRETVIAPTAASVSVTATAAGLRHPDRAVGLHFHRPLADGLVELVVTDHTAGGALERAETFVDDLACHGVRVRDTPGLVSTRLALALEVEAMRLVDAGVADVSGVDAAMTAGHEHATGPLEQADRAGLARRLRTLEYLAETLGSHFEPPELLRDLVAADDTGADAGRGFYLWEGGEPTESAIDGPDLHGGEELPDDPGLT